MPHYHMWVFLLVALLPVSTELNASTYYIACDTGYDANEGLSELNAWKSATKVSRFKFMDGDKILFKRGCTWEDVSIKIMNSVDFGAYGDAATPPQLMGAIRVRSWSNLKSRGIFYTQAAIESGGPWSKEILIVHDKKHGRFYAKVRTLESLDSAGTFFHDVATDTLYVSPLEGVNLQQDIHISSKPHILEFQQVNVDRVVVDGLHLSFANEYAIGFWYQSSGTRNGSLKVENCVFTGNAYQAIHIGGTNTFRDVDILNNTITANGNEGIYIGYIKGSEEGEVVTRMLRISGNSIGGEGFGWRSIGPDSSANGDGIDIKKGIAAAIIDNNTIFDLNGLLGIGVLSSNVVIEKNRIRDIHMVNAQPESNIAAITVDAWDNKGSTIVRLNTIDVESANGVVIRGNAERRPRVEVYDNQISIKDPYFPFAFTSQNITNTTIRDNRTNGGHAGLWVLRLCCPPVNVEFHNNEIRDVSVPLLAAQDVSAGVRVYSNIFCLKSAVEASQKSLAQNNTFASDCTSPARPNPPRNIRIR